jgi:hypothetical protein
LPQRRHPRRRDVNHRARGRVTLRAVVATNLLASRLGWDLYR